jgi:tetratricopeptide (TPR) repeat protein
MKHEFSKDIFFSFYLCSIRANQWFLLLILGSLAAFLFAACEDRQSSLLAELDQLDLSQMEPQVAEKITSLHEKAKSDATSSEAWGKLAMNLDVHGLKAQAIACYQIAHEMAPQDFRWTYFCALALSESNSAESIAWYERSKILRPDYPPLLVRYGKALVEDGQFLKAKSLFQTALEKDGSYFPAYLEWAKAEISAGELHKAKQLLQKATGLNPGLQEARSLLANLRRQTGAPDRAEKSPELLPGNPEIQTMPDSANALRIAEGVSSYWYHVRGLVLMSRKQYRLAAGEFEAALTAAPSADTHYNLGIALKYQRQSQRAVEHFDKAIRLNPDFAEAKAAMGESLLAMGLRKQAKIYLKKAIATDTLLARAYFYLGEIYLLERAFDHAVATFYAGLKADPQNARIAFRMAWLLATVPEPSLRDGAEAVRLAEWVNQKTNSSSPEVLDILSAAYAENGDFEKAVEAAEMAYAAAKKARNHQLAEDIRARKKLYAKRKPYRI